MKISIVIPSYNQGKYIRRTIDSVLSQGYPDVELVVMDGGSTDETLEVLEDYSERIFWRSTPDRGQTQAVNNGWKLTSGQILGWVNSDDILLPGALNTVGECFETRPGVQWLYGNCRYIDASDRFVGDYPVQPYDYEFLVRNVQNYIPQPSVFLRRKVVDEAGLLNEDLHYVMDLEYWLRVGLKYPAFYLDTPLACLRLHQNAKSIAAFGKFSNELVVTIEALFARPDLPENIRRLKHHSLGRAYLLAADMNFWAGDLKNAGQYAAQSWHQRPFRLRRLYLYLMLGKLGLKIARRTHHNPYDMGMQA
ncbi:MAG: glycosyltransferase family 2 protein [Anaerolineales bacterium]|nr:glycosyltransferase family 2 protein [Anaerolineales bacterium]